MRSWCPGVALLCLVACGGEAEPVEPTAPVTASALVPPLVCPGAPSCPDHDGELRAGAAVRSITPALETWTDDDGNGVWDEGEAFDDVDGNGRWDPIWIAGFGNGRAAQSIHDDVWARVMVLEQGGTSLGLVSLDLIGFFHSDVIAIREAAASLGLDHIMVASTHGHEGPDTMGIWGRNVAETGYDADYVQSVIVPAVVDALTEAQLAAQPARLRYAQAEAPHLVNDTRLPTVIDQALTVLQLETSDGAALATATFWGNHPEALGSGNTAVTSDFAHYLRQALEDATGAPALYFNGSLGGLSTTIGIVGCPDDDQQETCPQGTFERAEYVGAGAAEVALEALASRPQLVEGDALRLSFRRQGFLATTSNAKFALAFSVGLLSRQIHHTDTKALLTPDELASLDVPALLSGDVAVQTEVNLIQLGPLAIATVPGELYPELWLATPDGGHLMERPAGADFPDAPFEATVQSMLPPDTVPIIVNNGNDAVGYIIPKAQWDVAPPYAYVDEGDGPQYGEENSLGEDAAALITEAFQELMHATP